MRILVTPRSLTESPHQAVEALRSKGVEIVYSTAGRLPDEAELLRLVPGIDGWLAGVEPISPAVIAKAGRLRCISRNGVGTDNLPLDLLKSRGIAVKIASGANAQGVAELALGLVFAGLRHIPFTDAGIKSGGWPRRRGAELRGRTLAVIGCGAVGREVARMGVALGAMVIGCDPLQPGFVLDPERFRWATLEQAFSEADIVSLHCPSRPDGEPVVGADVLARIRPGLVLVNTARAALVDEAALIAALEIKQVACYCTDVFDSEPPHLPGLASLSNVIATSHIGGYTDESVDRATEFAVANLMEALGPGAATS